MDTETARNSVAQKAAQIVQLIRPLSRDLSDINETYPLEWRVRTAVRDLEGMLDRVEDQASEVLDRVGTDVSEGILEDLWGPFEDV
jgi:hypothetical protein